MASLPGASQTVTVGATVSLDGSASGANTYAWALVQMPSGSMCQLTGSLTVTPSFVADVVGDYILTLATDVGIFNSLGVRAIPA